MFRTNETHRQQDMFGVETQLSPELRKRLHESKEYAFYTEVFCRIPEEIFAELYAQDSASRPNAPVNTLVGAMLLQHQNDWTFEELLDRVAFDLKVRAALGLWSLGEAPFCRATLFNFQGRLRDHMVRTGQDKFQALFDRLSQEARERFGLKSQIQRCDSTQIGSNIRQYTRIELLVEVVLRMWRVLSEAHQAEHAERFASYVKAKTSGQFLYRLRRSEIEAALESLGQLYAWMVPALEADYGSCEIYRTLCRVFAEHFACAGEKTTVRPAGEMGSGSLQSPDDPEATYRKKEAEGYRGFVLHTSETAHPENPFQLLTDVVVAPNNEEDSQILHERLGAMHEKTPDLRHLHHDAAYGSKDNDRLQAELGIEAVQSAISGYPARAPVQIERDGQGLLHARCAGGHTVPGQKAKVHYKAMFPADRCAGCPFASVCPAEPRASGGRTLLFREDDVLRQARHRRLQSLPEEQRTLRANVEATIKEFKAPCRDGKLRTRGLHAARRYAFLRALAINFGRIYRYVRSLAPAPAPTAPAAACPRPAQRRTAPAGALAGPVSGLWTPSGGFLRRVLLWSRCRLSLRSALV